MAIDRNIPSFNAADIEKYHKGLLSDKEMHALEKAALDDPFLADALDGYAIAGVQASADLAELQERLSQRTTAKVIPISREKDAKFAWLRIAAMIILVAGAGLLVYRFAFNNKNEHSIAQQENKKETVFPLTDTFQKSSNAVVDNIDTPLVIENKKTPKTSPPLVISQGDLNQEIKEYNGNAAAVQKDSVAVFIPGVAVTRQPSAPVKTEYKELPRNTIDNAIADKEKALDDDKKIQSEQVNGLYSKKDMGSARKLNTREQLNSNIFRGQVMDNNRNALPFANITNTRDNVGTYSDANGFFTLTSPDSVMDVQVRSLGYNNYNYRLRNNNDARNNQVVLQEDNAQLSEVVLGNRGANSQRPRSTTTVLEEPEPVDGWDNYDTYIANNLNTRQVLKAKPSVAGEVEVSFEVDKNGKPINITVDKSLCESCDKEAVRLVKEGPKFKRKGKKKGRTTVTVAF